MLRSVLTTLTAVASLVALILSGYALRGASSVEERLEKRLREVDWTSRLLTSSDSASSVEPTVGTIQFIKHGYSIQLEGVNYLADGLHLSGHVGNPTHLTIHELTLTVRVSKSQLSPSRDEFLKNPPSESGRFVRMLSHDEIGHAQSAPIRVLLPGTRAPFAVTVPNVKQSNDGLHLEIAFSGAERYSYQ